MSPRPTTAPALLVALALGGPVIAQVADRDLPRLEYAEPWTPPADHVALEIQRDGTLRLDGKNHDLRGIASLLMTRNDGADLGEPVATKTGKRRFRTTPVLIRAHRDPPAVAVAEVIRNLGVRRLSYWQVLIASQGNRATPHHHALQSQNRFPAR